MDALDLKLLRDFRRLWAQALAIALVLACGVAILLMAFGMSRALDDSRDAFYERNRFGDVFAEARRAPLSLVNEIAAIDGVMAAEARVWGHATLDIEGRAEIAIGRVQSLPEAGPPRLNVPLVTEGRLPETGSPDEVAVNEPFAQANGFRPGDTLTANLNGRKRELTITGTVLSPEFIYTLGPGAMVPDNEGYGILWMSDAAASAALGMTGAFNSVSLLVAAGQPVEPVIERVDDILEPYGGLGAYGRSEQQSNAFISAEILQLQTTAYILPPIFFGISAFLVAMVLGRIIALERSEIGLLKAIGYSDMEVAAHYLMLSGLIGLVGIVAGWAVGHWLARELAQLYADFFEFPYVVYRVSYSAFVISGFVGLLTTVLGATNSALRAARLAPAVAMAPPAPPRFRRTTLDRLLTVMRLSQPTMMILRSLMRWPLRSALTSLGVAMAVAILAASNSFPAALDRIIEVAFNLSNRQDAMLLFSEDIPQSGIENVRRLPGVLMVEGQQYHAAEVRNGHIKKRVFVEARPPGTDLSRVFGGDSGVIPPPEHGVLLSERLADYLGVRVGDMLEVEFLSGRRGTHMLPVEGTLVQYFGLGLYIDQSTLNRLFQQAPQITVANVMLDEGMTEAFHDALKDMPKLAGTIMLTESRRSFRETIRQNIVIMTVVYVTIAVLITVGVTYNGCRIQLSERARELASLRILGFGRGEISYILMGETMLLALLAQPLGWVIGIAITYATTQGFESDLYRVPLVLKPSVFALASLVVLTAAFVSVLVVRRRLDRLDLVAVMKTRE